MEQTSRTKACINLSLFIELFLFIGWIPARYIFAVLGSISLAILYGLKVNLSVAIVVMVNHTSQYTDSSNIIHSSCSTNGRDDISNQVRQCALSVGFKWSVALLSYMMLYQNVGLIEEYWLLGCDTMYPCRSC